MDSAFYDRIFSTDHKWRAPYTDSSSYGMWVELVKYLTSSDTILEIGCGTGRLGHMIYVSKKVKSYIGLDFSLAGISHANELVPKMNEKNFSFICADVFDSDVIETASFNTVISCEFLEHINDDLIFMERLSKIDRPLKYLMSFKDKNKYNKYIFNPKFTYHGERHLFIGDNGK